MSDQDDQQLIALVKEGDKKAFDRLVIKYQQRIIQLVSRYISDASEAQDVAQEAFIKTYKALPNFRGDSAFYTWLYRIAVNTAKNHLVSRARKSSDHTVDVNDAENFEGAFQLKEGDTPEHLLLSEEIRSTIQQAINDLPDELRNAISYRELDGMSYEEIAQKMKCPVGTVRSRIFRAREAVDKILKPLL
ncbi:MAG: RNA polymerase sigma factor RpoE [Cycloclasticus pugetii]|jgi:RNA polymerase sigma-70 factor (ECF subfamily)|uniref:RNA polymerase sigma factor n=1 Tax=Cycloclasticus zancles 78-ME TaxID=1198232 RepID=S5TXI0_9GAMM|nr:MULTISPECIES: RNA polymerase sigma factor RpoE [Cycloclasticus]AFT67107.1 RNA polymerase sigma factor [Cycloclasticus sp. P1]AGS39855.1 RNA polymerase sigma factor RpoE [Cycloclasticus zancles 78-ME]MBV1899977.1 RNA polymerase sigma factor RpoE [Cycloclasticus sp.]MDF1828920.1 RNA polymerase sigma factor RpoE [Cycloclasticus pugetii]SHJ36837.1 RNA polymerase, sigma-24 subunit, RpoE [Cycloclasticus pugetii]